MKYKNVLIVAFGDTGNEPEALRQVLENFGYFVVMSYIGRPDDFRNVLAGEIPFSADCVILSCHGENGSFVMPVLAEEIYRENEVRGNYSAVEVQKELQLRDKLILSLGCTTGNEAMCKVFEAENQYLAPDGYVDGNAALFFTIRLFYELAKAETPVKQAFLLAKEADEETELFVSAGLT